MRKQDQWVDPEMAPVIERMTARLAERGPIGSVSPDEMRRRFREDTRAWNEHPPAIAAVSDGWIDGALGRHRYRLYDPFGDGRSAPCMIYFHGGGWIVGDYACNDRTMRLLARDSGVAILSADYRLAPENPFPAGLEDCIAITRNVVERADEIGIDRARIGICGDSAGGNLALSTAIELRDDPDCEMSFVFLMYPALSPDSDTESHRLFGNGEFGMGTTAMRYFWGQYLGDPSLESDPRAAPVLGDLAGLPPTLIVSGGLDPLRDDSYWLERRLQRAGVSCEHRCYPGVVHGFMSMTNFLEVARTATAEAAASIQHAFREPQLAVRRM